MENKKIFYQQTKARAKGVVNVIEAFFNENVHTYSYYANLVTIVQQQVKQQLLVLFSDQLIFLILTNVN